MSTLEVNNIKDTGSNSLISSNGSGTFTINNSVLKATPAFEAHVGSNQTFTSAIATKVQFNTESFDTDGCYDHTTNYRFTPTVAGKYFVYLDIGINANGNSEMNDNHCFIYKNGSIEQRSHTNFRGTGVRYDTPSLSAIITMNGSTDYIEAYVECSDGVGNPLVQANPYTRFGAYKLIGV